MYRKFLCHEMLPLDQKSGVRAWFDLTLRLAVRWLRRTNRVVVSRGGLNCGVWERLC